MDTYIITFICVFCIPNPLRALLYRIERKHLQCYTKTHLFVRRLKTQMTKSYYMEKRKIDPLFYSLSFFSAANDNSSLAITIRGFKLAVIWQCLTMSTLSRYRWKSMPTLWNAYKRYEVENGFKKGNFRFISNITCEIQSNVYSCKQMGCKKLISSF